MYTHHILLILHLIAATIWVGGHLVLAIAYLPKALRHKDFSYIGKFEQTYEPVGMPSLLVLVITGVWMAYDYGVTFSTWLHFDFSIEKVVSLKLLCLLSTVCFAISAQTRVLPKLRKGDLSRLREMAVHIICVTLLGVTMLVLGSLVRIGGIQ
nr:CopD family protein [uncultured Capnocytophaga sp.]